MLYIQVKVRKISFVITDILFKNVKSSLLVQYLKIVLILFVCAYKTIKTIKTIKNFKTIKPMKTILTIKTYVLKGLQKYYYYWGPIGDRQCLARDSSETDMPHQRPIRYLDGSLETDMPQWNPTCRIGDRHT